MKRDQFIENAEELEQKKASLIENTINAIATGKMLIDVRIEPSPLHYHPWLSELPDEFRLEKEYLSDEEELLDQAVLAYSRHGTLRLSRGCFLENALNGNMKQTQKDIAKHAVDPKFNENHVMTDFKIKLEDITVIDILKIL